MLFLSIPSKQSKVERISIQWKDTASSLNTVTYRILNKSNMRHGLCSMEPSFLKYKKRLLMDKPTSTLLKLTALVGGAVLGTLLGRWFDTILTKRIEEQSERDRTHYARGLTPISQKQET